MALAFTPSQSTTAAKLVIWAGIRYSTCQTYFLDHSPVSCSKIHVNVFSFVANYRVGKFRREPDWRAITEGEDVKAVWVQPTPELIIGEVKAWADAANVKPIHIPGYWYEKPGTHFKPGMPANPGEKVIYMLHGGGYWQLSAHPSNPSANITRGLLDACDNTHRAFSLEYRLSSSAPYAVANPFPTALVDAIAGYHYLIDTVGFEPEDVTIAGDSSGGNLALALVRYLVENKTSSTIRLPPPPGSLILLSPWCDMGPSHDIPGQGPWVPSDYVGTSSNAAVKYAKRSFIGPHDADMFSTNRYVSPASLDLRTSFKYFPKTFLNAGGAEVFLNAIRTLRLKMVEDMGQGFGQGQLTYFETPDSIHDTLLFPWQQPQRGITIDAIRNWMSSP